MKRIVLTIFALAFAGRLHAGIMYRSETITEGVKAHSFTGIVKVEGGKSRIDVVNGDEKFAASGSVILSSTGSPVLTVFNPARKTYYEIDPKRLSAAAANVEKEVSQYVTMTPPKIKITPQGDGDLIEGYPTRHSRVQSSTTIQARALGYLTTTRIDMTSDIWSTDKLPQDAARQIQLPIHGGEGLEKMIEATQGKLPGFPLRSVSTTTMTIKGGSTVTMTTRSNVTNIRRATFAPSEFTLPSGLKKVDSPLDALMRRLGN